MLHLALQKHVRVCVCVCMRAFVHLARASSDKLQLGRIHIALGNPPYADELLWHSTNIAKLCTKP